MRTAQRRTALHSRETGACEVVAIFVAILLGGPLIFLPVQILWMNLVTDGMTAVALGLEPAERSVMQRPPRPPSSPVIDAKGFLTIAIFGLHTVSLNLEDWARIIALALPIFVLAEFTKWIRNKG